ncbi:hypothetical protein B0H12DRAFT_114284 [Mycena haematopus]|nr:hypothetical protein B0H12DRAFT_114284 [Mycena haematopus]
MLQCKGFAAWVSIDGTEAPEYGVEISEDQKSVTCWIPSELGKKFSVNWKNTSHNGDTRGRVFMDGTMCGGIMLGARDRTTATKRGIQDSQLTVRPFVFSSLELTDDDAFLGSSLHQELGLIEIQIEPVQVMSGGPPPKTPILSEIKVHERSKKAVTQQITATQTGRTRVPHDAYIKGVLSAYWPGTGQVLLQISARGRPSCQWNYAACAPAAQAESVRRVSTSETPDTDEDEDAREEKMLRERLNAIEAKRLKKNKKPRIKNESDSTIVDLTQNGKKKKVKSESGLTFVQGEIIDLT